MDFFDHQEAARKKTKWLVFYFILAVIGITLSVYAVLTILGFWSSPDNASRGGWLDWNMLGATGLGTLTVILLGSGFKSLQLNAGGAFVAKELGGRRLDPHSSHPAERRLLNIVEEMAIASGTPVPEVFVLEDENTVNAFAAGKNTGDAVIGVTRGCMNMLSRDELQAVMAHEFSHILHGDMRLNMRLIALIFGITALTIVGRILLHSSSGSRNRNGVPFVALGLALIAIGFVGVLCGRLIQRAVSRQREFLADASAVQFTRNPDGMTGALKKIGALGSRVADPHAEEASHMMIASALSDDGGSLWATHPPLSARIRAIDPHWDGTFDDVKLPAQSRPDSQRSPRPARAAAQASGFAGAPSTSSTTPPQGSQGARPAPAPDGMPPLPTSETNFTQAGSQHLQEAHRLLEGLPHQLRQLASRTDGAEKLVLALLTGETEIHAPRLLRDALPYLSSEDLQEVIHLHATLHPLHSASKLALADLAIPSLRTLSSAEYRRFRTAIQNLIASDSRIDLFEFALEKMIVRHLDSHFRRTPGPSVRHHHLRDLQKETALILALLAEIGSQDEAVRRQAFDAGAQVLEPHLASPLTYRSPRGLRGLDEALDRFDAAAPMVKKHLLQAAARIVLHDRQTTSREAELLRAIADTIGVPIPPFVSQSALAA